MLMTAHRGKYLPAPAQVRVESFPTAEKVRLGQKHLGWGVALYVCLGWYWDGFYPMCTTLRKIIKRLHVHLY